MTAAASVQSAQEEVAARERKAPEKKREISRFIVGDSVEILNSWTTSCIDLTVTSPPYDDLRSYKGYHFDAKAMLSSIFDVTKPGVVCCVRDSKMLERHTNLYHVVDLLGSNPDTGCVACVKAFLDFVLAMIILGAILDACENLR